MDQKRTVAFMVLSLGVLALSWLLFPPPPPRPPQPPKPAIEDRGKLAAENEPAEIAARAEVGEGTSTETGDVNQQAAAGAVPPAEAEADVPLEFVTLGSLDAQAGYRMLVTLTNRGAAVHRTELTNPHFRDLQDRSGYLGHLELENSDRGPIVAVVGKGTPAEKAKLQVGDVIVGFDGPKGQTAQIGTIEDFESARAKTEPNDEVTVRVLRGDEPEQSLAVKLDRRPLEVMRPEIENIEMRKGTPPPGFIDPPSFLLTLARLEGKPLEGAAATKIGEWLERGNWRRVEDDASNENSVAFERRVPEHPLRIVKRYTLEPVPAASLHNENYPGYDVRLDVEIHNTGALPQQVAYRLDGPTGLPIEGWWYSHKISQRWFSSAGLRDVAVRFQGSSELQIDCSTIAADKAETPPQGQPLAYAGVDAIYFSSMLIPKKSSLDDDWFESMEARRVGPKLDPRDPQTFTNVTCQLTRKSLELAPGDVLRDAYQVFIGPKRPELLSQYQACGDPNYSLRDLIYYGWFGGVARAMLSVLHFFYSIFGNYGIAIVMLTVLVRGCMFPISFKQTQNMARMQALKPEMDRITEKYKTDMQKRSQAINELYRKNKINPLGGCLPLFLQLPIFLGLYRSIMVDVELRQSPLFSDTMRWCSDLSAPDMLFDWSSVMPDFVNNGIGIFGLGPYFNLLPIITVALFLVSQKIAMPAPTNEQAVMQQKMMKYMTGFMGLLFYKVASGLCLYFIASSLWGLGERKLLGKAKIVGGDATAALPAPKPNRDPGNNGGSQNGSPGGKRNSKSKRKR